MHLARPDDRGEAQLAREALDAVEEGPGILSGGGEVGVHSRLRDASGDAFKSLLPAIQPVQWERGLGRSTLGYRPD
jgi:hypothetical protein